MLTEDGHRLLAIAEKMEALGLSVIETIRAKPSELSGRVRLATMEGIAAYYLTEQLVDFNALHPEILVELVDRAASDQSDQAGSRHLDQFRAADRAAARRAQGRDVQARPVRFRGLSEGARQARGYRGAAGP